MNIWDYMKAINDTKEDVIVDEETEKGYVPFIINRGLSYFPDTILYANEMNQRAATDKAMQFSYLKESIRKRKRYSKWFKKEEQENIDLIIKYYNVSRAKALNMLPILTPENIAEIKRLYNEGGKV